VNKSVTAQVDYKVDAIQKKGEAMILNKPDAGETAYVWKITLRAGTGSELALPAGARVEDIFGSSFTVIGVFRNYDSGSKTYSNALPTSEPDGGAKNLGGAYYAVDGGKVTVTFKNGTDSDVSFYIVVKSNTADAARNTATLILKSGDSDGPKASDDLYPVAGGSGGSGIGINKACEPWSNGYNIDYTNMTVKWKLYVSCDPGIYEDVVVRDYLNARCTIAKVLSYPVNTGTVEHIKLENLRIVQIGVNGDGEMTAPTINSTPPLWSFNSTHVAKLNNSAVYGEENGVEYVEWYIGTLKNTHASDVRHLSLIITADISRTEANLELMAKHRAAGGSYRQRYYNSASVACGNDKEYAECTGENPYSDHLNQRSHTSCERA